MQWIITSCQSYNLRSCSSKCLNMLYVKLKLVPLLHIPRSNSATYIRIAHSFRMCITFSNCLRFLTLFHRSHHQQTEK